jgi:hypothetical protein
MDEGLLGLSFEEAIFCIPMLLGHSRRQVPVWASHDIFYCVVVTYVEALASMFRLHIHHGETSLFRR